MCPLPDLVVVVLSGRLQLTADQVAGRWEGLAGVTLTFRSLVSVSVVSVKTPLFRVNARPNRINTCTQTVPEAPQSNPPAPQHPPPTHTN